MNAATVARRVAATAASDTVCCAVATGCAKSGTESPASEANKEDDVIMVTAGPRPAGHETGGTDAPPAIPYETLRGSKLMGARTNLRVYPYRTADDIMHGVYAYLNTATVNPFDQYYAMQMSHIISFDPRGQCSGKKGWAAAPPAPERAPHDAAPCSSASSFPTLQSSSTRTTSTN